MVNIETVNEINQYLNSRGIVWGVGGSYLLQLYGLYDNPSDLDLWVHPAYMKRVKALFSEFQQIETKIYLPEDYHFKIAFKDTEVDFVASFIIKPNQNEFEYDISERNVYYHSLNETIQVPCTFLENWYIIYRLLKRDDKANLIRSYLLNRDSLDQQSKEILRDSLNTSIPRYLKKDIKALLKLYEAGVQLSLLEPI